LGWLADRRDAIEARLAARHLTDGGMALSDPTSPRMPGRRCPPAAYGHPRDARPDHPQITYGPPTAGAVPGNTGDPTAFTALPCSAAGSARRARSSSGTAACPPPPASTRSAG
jgi:hypothetical protein